MKIFLMCSCVILLLVFSAVDVSAFYDDYDIVYDDYDMTTESIFFPDDFEIIYSGLEDMLFTYLSALFRDPYDKLSSWDEASADDRAKYFVQLELKFNELLFLYQNPLTSAGGMGQWFLRYLHWLEDFDRELITPRILITGEILFQLPRLVEQYFTYMPIRAITYRNSRQFAFRPHLQVDELGFMRFGEAYSIALGTYFGSTIGDIYRMTFADGSVALGVLTDVKANRDTDITNRYADSRWRFDGSRGNIVEFVMDDRAPQFLGLPRAELVATINGVVRGGSPYRVVE